MSRWVVAAVVLVAGCASSRPEAPPPDIPAAPEGVTEPAAVVDREALEGIRDSLEAGGRGWSTPEADSLWAAWLGVPGLDRESARDLAELLRDAGDHDRAAHLYLRAPFELEGGDRDRLRRLAGRLSIRELQGLLEDSLGRSDARWVLMAELATALAVADHPGRAREIALAIPADSVDGEERDRAEAVLEGRVEPVGGPVRVGIVLPLSGRFAVVGEQILAGVQLALDRYRSDADTAPLELAIRDDSSRVERSIELVEELEEEDVIAVLGPVRTEALMSATLRRDRPDLFLVSPTAAGGQGVERDAYTLWDRERREADVAAVVVRWMADSLGIRSYGLLHPTGISPAAVDAVREAAAVDSGAVVHAEPYAADSTTFGGPITALAEREPEAIVVFADRPRTVLQLAPQIVYYGLRRWVTGGDANWSDPDVVRRLDASYADHRLVGTYVDRVSAGTAWKEFEAMYEAEYRTSLPDNMFAALGHDAMRLILAGAPEAEWERRGAIGRTARRGRHAGASGTLVVDSRSGQLHREVFVRVIDDGELVVPVAAEMVAWAEEQRQLEEFLKALEEEEEGESLEEGAP